MRKVLLAGLLLMGCTYQPQVSHRASALVAENGYFNNGYFNNGYFNNGYFNNGYFNNGYFNNGYFNNGYFNNGLYTTPGITSSGINYQGFNGAALSAVGAQTPIDNPLILYAFTSGFGLADIPADVAAGGISQALFTDGKPETVTFMDGSTVPVTRGELWLQLFGYLVKSALPDGHSIRFDLCAASNNGNSGGCTSSSDDFIETVTWNGAVGAAPWWEHGDLASGGPDVTYGAQKVTALIGAFTNALGHHVALSIRDQDTPSLRADGYEQQFYNIREATFYGNLFVPASDVKLFVVPRLTQPIGSRMCADGNCPGFVAMPGVGGVCMQGTSFPPAPLVDSTLCVAGNAGYNMVAAPCDADDDQGAAGPCTAVVPARDQPVNYDWRSVSTYLQCGSQGQDCCPRDIEPTGCFQLAPDPSGRMAGCVDYKCVMQ